MVGEETCPTEGEVFDRVEELVAKYAPREEKTNEKPRKDSMRRDSSKKNYFVLDPIDGTKAFAATVGSIKSREVYVYGAVLHWVVVSRWERWDSFGKLFGSAKVGKRDWCY